eukprot:3640614-Rhodomonas_salina.1
MQFLVFDSALSRPEKQVPDLDALPAGAKALVPELVTLAVRLGEEAVQCSHDLAAQVRRHTLAAYALATRCPGLP